MESASLGRTSFKQRLIGAIVLVSLAVIFLPMLFDEPHSDRVTREIEVPADPNLPEIRISAPERPSASGTLPVTSEATATMTAADGDAPVDVEVAEPVSGEAVDLGGAVPESPSAPTTTVPTTVAPAVQAPVAPVSSVPAAVAPADGPIMLQLGSFGNKPNALALRDKARGLGYSAHSDDVTVNGQSLTRVWVGPFADKPAAERVQPALDKALGMKSRVLTR